MEIKVAEKIKGTNLRIDKLRALMKANLQAFTTITTHLDKTCANTAAAQTARIEATRSSFGEQVATMERKLSDGAATMRWATMQRRCAHRFDLLHDKLEDQFNALDIIFEERPLGRTRRTSRSSR